MSKKALVGEICLYGTRHTGAGWLARVGASLDGHLIGDAEPNPDHTFTEAVWMACDALRNAGIKAGMVRVFESGGKNCADTDINNPGYYGDLKWVPAPVYVIDADTILAAAAK